PSNPGVCDPFRGGLSLIGQPSRQAGTGSSTGTLGTAGSAGTSDGAVSGTTVISSSVVSPMSAFLMTWTFSTITVSFDISGLLTLRSEGIKEGHPKDGAACMCSALYGAPDRQIGLCQNGSD